MSASRDRATSQCRALPSFVISLITSEAVSSTNREHAGRYSVRTTNTSTQA